MNYNNYLVTGIEPQEYTMRRLINSTFVELMGFDHPIIRSKSVDIYTDERIDENQGIFDFVTFEGKISW